MSGSGCIWVWLLSQKQLSVTSNPHPHHQDQKVKLQLVSLAHSSEDAGSCAPLVAFLSYSCSDTSFKNKIKAILVIWVRNINVVNR